MSKYLLWDVDESNLYYTFSKEELKDVNLLEFINLHKRAGFSEYKLPLDSEVGKQITLSNRDFAFHNSGNYYGIKLFLSSENKSQNHIYWFMFKDQTATFLFNGKRWILSAPWPQYITNINFIEESNIETGFLNIRDFLDPVKKDLFNNLGIDDNDVLNLEGRFFRQGNIYGKIEDDDFRAHKHTATHSHNMESYLSEIQNAIQKLMNKKNKLPLPLRKLMKMINKRTKGQPHKIFSIIKDRYRLIYLRSSEENRKKLDQYIKKYTTLFKIKEIVTMILTAEKTRMNIPEEVLSGILGVISQVYDDVIKEVKASIDPIWDDFISIVEDVNPGLALVLKLKEKAIKKQIIDWIDKKSPQFKKTLLETIEDTIRNTPELYNVVTVISNTILTRVVLADTTPACPGENHLPVVNSIPNRYIDGSKPHDGNKGTSDGIKELFSVEQTSEAEIIIHNNDGLDETRPDNIQGQYIVKCW